MSVCDTCGDTHRMTLRDRTVMCTRCPVPCPMCRAGGIGPYCEATPCGCGCHVKVRPTALTRLRNASTERTAAAFLSIAKLSAADFELQRAAIAYVAELARNHPEVLDFRADQIAALKPIEDA